MKIPIFETYSSVEFWLILPKQNVILVSHSDNKVQDWMAYRRGSSSKVNTYRIISNSVACVKTGQLPQTASSYLISSVLIFSNRLKINGFCTRLALSCNIAHIGLQ